MDDIHKKLRELDALLRDPLSDLLRDQKRQRELVEGFGRSSVIEITRAAAQISRPDFDLRTSVGSLAQAAETALGRLDLVKEAARLSWPDSEIGTVLGAARLGTQAVAQARLILDQQRLSLSEQTRAAQNWGVATRTELGAFKPFAPLADQLYSELGRVADLAWSRAGFASDLLSSFSRVAEAADEEEIVAAWNAAAEWYLSEAKARTRGPIDYLAFFSIFLALLIFLYQKESAAESEARILERVSQSEERILNALSELAPEGPGASVVISLRSLRLRASPTSKSKALKAIAPNTPLEIVEIRGQWLRVRVFDIESGKVIAGWAYGRFVGRMRFDP